MLHVLRILHILSDINEVQPWIKCLSSILYFQSKVISLKKSANCTNYLCKLLIQKKKTHFINRLHLEFTLATIIVYYI